MTASGFRTLVADHEHQELEHRQEHRRAAAEQRRRKVAELIDRHISDKSWRGLVHEARQTAERGGREFMVLRFPSQLCSDRGRAVNVAGPDWPATLRGEAAEIYLRWERDLKPNGFRLAARNFMLLLGPVSSFFDFLTFGLLLLVFHADVALFQTGWFIESLATQILVVFVLRTRRNPLRSHPHPLLATTSVAVVVLAVVLPFTPLGARFGFVPPSAAFLFAIAGLTVTYLLLAQGANGHFTACGRRQAPCPRP